MYDGRECEILIIWKVKKRGKEMSNLLNENEWEWETADGFEPATKEAEDTRPAWAKKIQGYHHNYEQIDRIKKVVGEVEDDADITIQARKVRMGDRSYTTDVFLNGENVGKYSY